MTDLAGPFAGGAAPSAQAVATASVHGLLSAAALHLGEATEDGRRLAAPDPQEAWRAIIAADVLVRRFEATLPPEAAERVRQLTERLARLHPDQRFPIPASPGEGGRV